MEGTAASQDRFLKLKKAVKRVVTSRNHHKVEQAINTGQLLKMGDFVTLHHKMAVFHATAMVNDSICLSETSERYTNNVFQICVRNRISAAANLEQFERASANMQSALGLKQHAALLATLEKEQALNDRMMESKSNTALVFGCTVQLRHIASGKYLTVSPNEVAKCEPENFACYLTAQPSKFSWIKISPDAVSKDGDSISNNSSVIFRPVMSPGMSLHACTSFSTHNPEHDHDRELNCSLEPSTFRLVLYSAFERDRLVLVCGDVVCLEEPNRKHCIGPVSRQQLQDDLAKDRQAESDSLMQESDLVYVPRDFSAFQVPPLLLYSGC